MSGSDDHAYHAADPSTTAVSFYAGDREEPGHIHVEWDVNAAKFWLDSISFASSGCLRRNEIGGIQRLVEGRSLKKWLSQRASPGDEVDEEAYEHHAWR